MSNSQGTLSPLSDLLPGTIVRGAYRIESKVGGGGMAVVYKVTEFRTRSVWAIKELRLQPGSGFKLDEARKQFEQEATLLSSLDHPNLTRVVDYFEENGRAYLIMEFVDGQTLERHQQQSGGIVSEQTVISWTMQLCGVLAYLHSQNPPIIFRDIKPSNIMMSRTGQLKLIDFGIARTYKAGKTSDTISMGSENYAPCEQWGKGQTDARSDIYALGATMYHLLTGQPPRIALDPTPLAPPRSLNTNLSLDVERIIIRAMEAKPEDRFQKMYEFEQAMAGLLTKRSIPSGDNPSPMIVQCMQCAYHNRLQATFCGRCGASLVGVLPAALQILRGKSIGGEIPVSRNPFHIGRIDESQGLPGLDLSPYDPQFISRNHAVITHDGSHYILTDLDSVNGTFVNGRQLMAQMPHTLRNGDRIAIGAVRLVFKLSAVHQTQIHAK